LRGVVTVAGHDIAIELANGGRERAEGWSDSVWEGGIAEFFECGLTSKIIIRAIGKGQLNNREAKNRARATGNDVRHIVECSFDGDRDLLFDLFGGVSWEKSNDDDLGIRNIRICF
jgi:hypothetical protein